jgi:hypothetical protein
MATIRLLIPPARSSVARVTPAPRPPRLADVAFLDNGQPRFVPIAPLRVRALGERPGATVHTYRKSRCSSPAGDAMLDDIARSSRVAVVGLAC